MAILLRIDEVANRLKSGKTKIYEMIKLGDFPPPVKIGRSSRWVDEDVDNFIQVKEDARCLSKN